MYSLAPKYEELGALYFNNPDYSKKVIIAKVDATLNDVPDDINGFPTIKLFPAGSSEAVEYSGSRTIEDLAKFIKENGKYGVDAYVTPAKDETMPDAETLGQQAPAASEKAGAVKEKVKSVVRGAAEAVKSAGVGDGEDDGIDNEIRDEL